MRVSRTILGGAVAVVGLVAVVAVGGLVVGGAPHQGGTTLSVAKPPPPPPPSGGCAMDSGYWVCTGSPGAEKIGTSTSSPSPTAAVEESVGVGAGPPFPFPFMIGPAKPWLAGEPEPQPRPILLMQLSAGMATAPASPTATVLLSDWPAAGKGTVVVSVYEGGTSDACSSPPLRTEMAAVLNEQGLWRAAFAGLAVGSYEVQATFAGDAGPMSTPCGRSALKVVPAPGSGQ